MILNDFKSKIIETINTSNLTIEVIYYIMKDIMYDVTNQYNTLLQQEAAAQVSIKEESQAVEGQPVTAASDINQEEEK